MRKKGPILSIAVPTFNMERWLRKNLSTYRDIRLNGRIEVLCLNNASEDSSKSIIEDFCRTCPAIFKLLDRDSRGYGSSINEAISVAQGDYFRIVDADDWVNTEELLRFVNALEDCTTDVVLTDYEIVNMENGESIQVRASEKGISYGCIMNSFAAARKTLPSIHGTTYRTELLRASGFYMQDKIFFVDEEYVVLPYLSAKTLVYYPFDVYRYQVANPQQSTSPKNRAKYADHRERVLRRLIESYLRAEHNVSEDALSYCYERICRGVGDHFTTLYMYMPDRKEGRRKAADWKEYLLHLSCDQLYFDTRSKAIILYILNRFSISLKRYEQIKRIFKRRG